MREGARFVLMCHLEEYSLCQLTIIPHDFCRRLVHRFTQYYTFLKTLEDEVTLIIRYFEDINVQILRLSRRLFSIF